MTGCSRQRFFDEYVFPASDISAEDDERSEENALLGVGSKPSNMIELTSQELVSSIRFGWNMGNSLEACLRDRDGDGNPDVLPAEVEQIEETLWGNPAATRELFKGLVDSGVNAVRLPITWRDHIDENGVIEINWLNRVEQVVDYAYNCGLYVVINVYYDGSDDAEYGAWLRGAAKDAEVTLSRYTRLWEQIAERFKNYNERLIFESMDNVGFDMLMNDTAYELLNTLNQTFVDTVRSSGGNNDRRHLMVAGYFSDIGKTCDQRFHIPSDPAASCIVSVHYYTPWEFCTSDIQDSWGSYAEEREMDSLIEVLCDTFLHHGNAVIISEYGARGDHDSVVYFCERLVKLCRDSGIGCFIWDDGSLFDREEYEWRDTELLEAILRASSGEDYTPQKGTSPDADVE